MVREVVLTCYDTETEEFLYQAQWCYLSLSHGWTITSHDLQHCALTKPWSNFKSNVAESSCKLRHVCMHYIPYLYHTHQCLKRNASLAEVHVVYMPHIINDDISTTPLHLIYYAWSKQKHKVSHCVLIDSVRHSSGPFYSIWVSNYIHYKMWDEITYIFPNYNGLTVEVWEWIRDFIPHFIMELINYPCWD